MRKDPPFDTEYIYATYLLERRMLLLPEADLEQLANQLEDRFERSAKRNLMGARPNNWELYGEFFRQLVDTQTDAGLPHLFADRLRIAYGSYGKDDGTPT